MKNNIDYEALKSTSTSVCLYRAIEGINLSNLCLYDLVKLKALFSKRIQSDNVLHIPKEVFDTYTTLLPDRPLSLQPFKLRGPEVRRVSLLTSICKNGGHLGAIANFVSFLVSMKNLDRVDVVFSAELAPKFWRNETREEFKAMVTEKLTSSIACFHEMETTQSNFLDKLHISVAPEYDELAEAIGEVVILYEGSIPSFQYRLCTRSIFEQRPIIATIGSSAINQVPNIDLLLTPAKRKYRKYEVHYLRPLPRFPDDPELLEFNSGTNGRKVVLSGYGGDRLAIGLLKLSESDWDGIANLLKKTPNMHWHLFGTKDVKSVWRAFPPEFLDAFSKRITVSGVLELDDAFIDGFAFLSLPFVGGSGSVAKAALRKAVPVLVCLDDKQDMSNMFHNPAPHKNFLELIQVISDWVAEPGKRAVYLKHQLADINERANLSKKSSEFNELLSRATQLYRGRISHC